MQLAVRLAAILLAVTEITPGAQAATAAGATVDDLKGKFVTPGLIDSCGHVGLVRDVAQDIKLYTRESVEQQLCIDAAYGVTDLTSVIACLKQQTGQ